MTYQGSKERFLDFILPVLRRLRKPGQIYVEPFMGSCAVLAEMENPRMGFDAHEDLVLFWQALVSGEFREPAFVTKEQYRQLMHSQERSALRGYVGFFWSFSGMFNKGYNQEAYSRSQSFSKAVERAKKLEGTIFQTQDVQELFPPDGSLIYCDPPYAGTTTYRGVEPFDYDGFYEWCRWAKRSKGCTVVVSEYSMPGDFVVIAELSKQSPMNFSQKENNFTEKLFMLP